MRRNYSRLARVEEGKNIRRAYAFGIATIVIIILLAVFGLPAISKIASYIFDMKKSTVSLVKDTTPPGPPFVRPLVEATNNSTLKIEGNAEPQAKIDIFVNDEKTETQVDNDGTFSTEVTLVKGNNIIYAIAKDSADNESVSSSKYTVYYSKDKPKLEVTKPSPGDNYFGNDQRQLTIEGATCVTCSVTVNGRIGLVDESGNFKVTYSLNDGGNDLNVVTTDRAGNHEETTISVNFTP